MMRNLSKNILNLNALNLIGQNPALDITGKSKTNKAANDHPKSSSPLFIK